MSPEPAPLTPPPLPPPPPPPRFTLPIAAWIAWGLYAVVMLTFAFKNGPPASAYAQGRVFGSIVGALLLPTLISWIAWRLCRRSPLARTLTFFVVLALSIFGQAGRALLRKQREDAFARLAQVDASMRAEQRAAAEKGQTLDPKRQAEFAERATAEFRNMTKNSDANTRSAAEAGQAMMLELSTAGRRYNEALAAVEVAAFFDLKALATAEQIAAKRAAVQAFAEANTAMQTLLAGGADRLQRELDKRGVSAAFARGTIAGYKESSAARVAIILKIRETDAQLATTLLAFLDVAEGRHGKWTIEQDTGKVLFETEAALERYNAAINQFNTISAEQADYQKQLVTLPTK